MGLDNRRTERPGHSPFVESRALFTKKPVAAESFETSENGPASVRRLLVAIIALWTLVEIGCAFVSVVAPLHHFGFSYNEGGQILSIEPGSPAERAGLRAGDRVLLDRLPAGDRYRLIHGRPGTTAPTIDFPVERDGRIRTVRLTAESDSVAPQTVVLEYAAASKRWSSSASASPWYCCARRARPGASSSFPRDIRSFNSAACASISTRPFSISTQRRSASRSA